MSMSIYLKTERLVLREAKENEAHLFFDLDSDPEVMKYLSGGQTATLQESEDTLQRILKYYPKYNHKLGLWIAEKKETGEFIGWFLLRPEKGLEGDVDSPELGYRLKKAFWGKGYGTEGARALLQKAFLDLNAKSVFAITMLQNIASQNIMKKIGMTLISEYEEKRCHAPGNDRRAVRFEIAYDNWLNRNN